MKKCLNRDQVKYIAIFAMLLDHIAWYFLDFMSPLAQVFHTVGRITAPIMCCFLAQGIRYTRSKKKYALRLLVFALIAQIPWSILHGEPYYKPDYNMLFTLLICLGMLSAFENIEKGAERNIIVVFLFLLSLMCDWFFLAPIFTLAFYFSRDNEKAMCIRFGAAGLFAFVITVLMKMLETDPLNAVKSSLYMLGVFLCIPLLLMYNGQKGRFKISKWVFYVFYPLHLGIIAIVYTLIS